jgi:hypothetical protein
MWHRGLRLALTLSLLGALLLLGTAGGASATPRDTDTPYTWPGAAILTVGTEPDGGGYVQSTPYLIDCPFACVRSVDPGTVLELTATPSQGFEFASWTGACEGQANPCTATIAKSADVTALFDYVGIPEQDFGGSGGRAGTYTLTVDIVHSPPASDRTNDVVVEDFGAINCPNVNCSAAFPAGKDVLLFIFSSQDNQYFATGLTGCDSGVGDDPPYERSCVVNMTSDRTVTVTYTAPDPPWGGP